MMKISNSLKRILVDYRDLLESGDINTIYNKIAAAPRLCGELTTLLLDSNVNIWEYFGESIPKCAFSGMSIDNIEIPSGIKNIGVGAFYECENLVSVNVGKGVKRIGEDAFYRCGSLKHVYIPDGVLSIGPSAFRSCKQLVDIELPDSVKIISHDLFTVCNNLTNVKLGNKVKVIEKDAFQGCSKLAHIAIPGSVDKIDIGAFSFCNSLEYIDFAGTKEHWRRVLTNSGRDSYTPVVTVKCIDGEIEYENI